MANRSNRVLIVEDNPDVRNDLLTLLSLIPRIEVVGDARDFDEIPVKVNQTQPDLVIIDLETNQPRSTPVDGISVVAAIKPLHPGISIFVLTVHGYPAFRQAVMQAGADGIFIKGQDTGMLIQAINSFSQSI